VDDDGVEAVDDINDDNDNGDDVHIMMSR